METLSAHINGKVIPYKMKKRERWNPEPLPPNEILALICGQSGCGKSTFILRLLPNVSPKYLKHVIVLSRIEGNEIYDAIKEWCKSKDITYEFTSDIDESMQIIEKRINDKTKEDEHICCIFDDWNQAARSEKSNPYNQVSIEMMTKGRNYKVHSIYITQQYVAIPTVIRVNGNMLVVFSMSDKNAKLAVCKDFTSLTGIDEETFYTLLNRIKIKHSYLLATSEGIWIYIHNQTNGLRKLAFE